MAATWGYTATKDELLARLARVEGQVRGVARMVEDNRYCIDVLTQINAVRAALDKIALGLLDDHARHCLLGEGGTAKSDEQADELMALLDLRGRLSGRLERWLREFGATPASRADFAETLARGGLASEIARRRGRLSEIS